MLERLRTKGGRISIALVTSVVIVAIGVAYDLPLPILAAILPGIWVPVFATQKEPVSPRVKKRLWVALGVGVLSLAVGVAVFFLSNN